MKTTVTGTLLNRIVHLDHSVDLPDNTRVNVEIAPLEEASKDRLAAWEAFQQRIRTHPMRSGGHRFTRDELHERD